MYSDDESDFGPKGAKDPFNPYRLERDLMSPNELLKRAKTETVPPEIQEWVDKWSDHEYDPMSEGCSIGVGYNKDVGWFVLGSGQGAFVIWIEGDVEPGDEDLSATETEKEWWLRNKNRGTIKNYGTTSR